MSRIVDRLAHQLLDADLVDDEEHAIAVAVTLVQTIRAELHADTESAAAELGLSAGGDIYRTRGDGTGTYLRCYYLDPRT